MSAPRFRVEVVRLDDDGDELWREEIETGSAVYCMIGQEGPQGILSTSRGFPGPDDGETERATVVAMLAQCIFDHRRTFGEETVEEAIRLSRRGPVKVFDTRPT